jgi:chromosome segregation protein
LRLKSLEVHGFKSFVDRTTLEFKEGITAVVGPNGCGKSNVVDAMRWVMGEQSPRRLRGKGMEDVIFAGSEGRSAVGMAEVKLTFDNSKGQAPPAFAAYAEIQVARRLYRDGESEYFLNRTACRLRDLLDFFRDAGIGTRGYAIVEQGHIAEIVSARAEDRRGLIEEAAGIGKYKARRREAESKLESTQQNLLRVNDVLGEIRRQIGTIERQAKRAARYKRLRETLRVIELSLAVDDRRALGVATEEAGRRRAGLEAEGTALEARLAEREGEAAVRRVELAECERAMSLGSEELLALRSEIKDAEGRIEYGRREREALAETVAARAEELARLRVALEAQAAEAASTGDELRAVETAFASEQSAVAAAEAEARSGRERVVALERERDASNAALVEVLTAVARAEDRSAHLEDRHAALDARTRSADEGLSLGQSEASRTETERRTLEEGLRNLLAERDRLMGLVRRGLETHERASAAARSATEALRAAREARETRRARLASLREVVERGEDLGSGVRHLLDAGPDASRRFGLRGLVRDVVEVDREVERAVEAVLGERAGALVVDAAAGAVDALDALRGAESGSAVFLTLPEPEPPSHAFVPLGAPLLERVRPRPGYEALAHVLLGGVYLVESLRAVLEVYGRGRVPATFVTAAGDLLAPGGVVRGGGAGAGGGLLARANEIRGLEREVVELDGRAAASEATAGEAEAAFARATDELENLRNRHHTAALAVANHEKDLERTRERAKALGEACEGRMSERSELLAESEAVSDERTRLVTRLDDLRRDRALRQRDLDALVLRIGAASRDATRLETVAAERRVEHAGRADRRDRLRGAFERAEAAAGESREWIARREREIESAEARREELAGVITASQAVLDARLREEEAARARIDARRDHYEQVQAGVNALEEAARNVRSEIAGVRERVGEVELALRESELRVAHLDQSVRERWEVELASWALPPLEPEAPGEGVAAETAGAPEDEGAAGPGEAAAAEGAAPAEEGEADEAPRDAVREARRNAELARLARPERERHLEETRRALSAIGEVNLGAIEEHEELSERFRFLSEQKGDLDRTIASLQDAIGRINRTSRKRFRETFEEVAKRFAENFPRLFNGGKASLSLTETEDVLEAGVEIMAMPPGKRLQNVNLLSGGEKTLTAIALLVAVFQVRPAPFFLLDEVDAALDDANVGRFNEIVRELSSESQFVVITHNKRTIEVADVLYGVTMERRGISKLVSVELH